MALQQETDQNAIAKTRNTARYFVENRQVAWVVLVLTMIWGIVAYIDMPKRKDPEIPVRVASAVTPWPGSNAELVEQLVTRAVETTIAESTEIHPPDPNSYGIKSLTLPGVSIVQVQLDETISDTKQVFNDINLRLNALNDSLPTGAGPVQFNSNFGDTSALLLTLASPRENEVQISLRARDVEAAIGQVRRLRGKAGAKERVTIVITLPRGTDPLATRRRLTLLSQSLAAAGLAADPRLLDGPGFAGLDVASSAPDEDLRKVLQHFSLEQPDGQDFHPDSWPPAFIRDPANSEAKLGAVAGPKYSYHDLDNFTDLIARSLEALPDVARVQRSGVLDQRVFLDYSQEVLAAYGLRPSDIKDRLQLQNTPTPGGQLQVEQMNLLIEPSGPFTEPAQIGEVIMTRSSEGSPVYVRDVVEISRGYQDPPRFLNFYSWLDQDGQWQRAPAIALAIEMRSGHQIGAFGKAIDSALVALAGRLPEDLIYARTSDQPRQVRENVDLFMTALYEAVILVVIIALLGFWEWRSALVIMISIPLTLALTFGFSSLLGIQLQQVSIATLIIALGLLVDDPVVASDAIKRDLALGHPPRIAAWLGPTKLAHAILFATITNVVAYLPLLLLTGNQGDFLHSLPIVMAAALVASRLVSKTFIPLLGYHVLRAGKRAPLPIAERRSHGFTGLYYKVGRGAIRHRKLVFLASLVLLAAGLHVKSYLKEAFFPNDIQYISYIDLWLRNDAALSATNLKAKEVEAVVRAVVEDYAKDRAKEGTTAEDILESVTTSLGGGAPRFWFSVTPQLQQQNYAQIIIRLRDKEMTPVLVPFWQQALTERIAGAYADVRQLQTNPVPYPVAVRLSGRTSISSKGEAEDIKTLRALALEVGDIFRSTPLSTRVRDDWGEDALFTSIQVDSAEANLAGVTNQDVAASSAVGISGAQATTMRQGNKDIPVVARLRPEQRARLGDLANLYIFSNETRSKVPLAQVARLDYGLELVKIRRIDHFRTITVLAFPLPGILPSQVSGAVAEQLAALEAKLPPGFRMEISGEEAKTSAGFKNLLQVMGISAAAIFIALVFQFKSAVKPILVFAAVPYGIAGALVALLIMDTPFGYMAFLGIIALIGVIVSHVILLFDFIEEMRRKGEGLEEALLDAGIVRLRPVLVTVGATVLALLPLALHGGPLWQPLCYAQIGGLTVATVVTLIRVPVLYSIFVLDLKIIRWEPVTEGLEATAQPA